MDDDLNTADAIAALFELTKDINVLIASGGPSKGTCRAARTLFGELCGVLGPFTIARRRNSTPKSRL